MKFQSAQDLKQISRLMRTAAGREEIGASLVEPLRLFQNYSSVMRRAFLVDPLPDGQIPYYDKFEDCTAYVVAGEGQDIQEVTGRDQRIVAQLFEIAANPMIPWTQIKQRRYDVQSTVQTSANSEIFRTEDKMLVKLLDKASTDFHPILTVSGANNLTIEHFSEAMSKIEGVGRNLRCVNIFMNPKHNHVLRKINKDHYSIDFETSSEIINAGFLATLFGATINTSGEIPEDKIYFTCDPIYLGRVVESIPLTVMPADDNAKRMVGWSVFEEVGAFVHNPKGVTVIKIS